MSAALSAVQSDPDRLSPFEIVFIRTVLEHRGLLREPSEAEFRAALDLLRRYDEQSAADPGGDAWEPVLDEERAAELRAKAFVMFGATRPTPGQWDKAHNALFGPLLCETCG